MQHMWVQKKMCTGNEFQIKGALTKKGISKSIYTRRHAL